MEISNFFNQVKSNQIARQTFKTNKFFQNPISFKSSFDKDVFEATNKTEISEAQETIRLLKAKKRELEEELVSYDERIEKEVFLLEKRILIRQARLLDEKIGKLIRRISLIEQNPSLAPICNPKNSADVRQKMAQESDYTIEIRGDKYLHEISKQGFENVKISDKNFVLITKKDKLALSTENDKKSFDSRDFLKIVKSPEFQDMRNWLDSINESLVDEIIEERSKNMLMTIDEIAQRFQVDKKRVLSLPLINREYLSKDGQSVQSPFVDMNNEKNREIFKRFHYILPKKSKYYIGGLTESIEKRNIPVSHLVSLGFGDKEELIELIKTKQISGGSINREGKEIYFVTINLENALYENPTLQILEELRNKNPDIISFNQLKKEFKMDNETLNQALIDGEFDLIPVYLNSYDREQKYINLSIPKNKQFYEKLRFEKEARLQELEKQRETKRLEKIEAFDYSRRMNSLRMKLVWSFMPKTRETFSELAKKDGYVSSLFAKMENDEELTTREKIKINSYYKEAWIKTGMDELKEAHQKVYQIIEAYKEYGLAVLDDETRAIFEQYGFC